MAEELTADRIGERMEVGGREQGRERLEGLLAARPLVEPLVGQGYLMWLHLASSFAFVGPSSSTGLAIPKPATVVFGPARAVRPGFDTPIADTYVGEVLYLATKSLFDRIATLLAVLVLAPLLLLVAALVRLTSPGPVLFRQDRLGLDGRHIPVLKFRTMVVDAEDRLVREGLWERYVEAGYKLPAHEDCRITPVGRFLRRTSLDELPQLFNVLKGDMSLVGPRPIVPHELRCYGPLAYAYLGVRPGITGLWQVSGRSSVPFPERADIDLDYFEHRSAVLDAHILLRTPLVVLRCTGAY